MSMHIVGLTGSYTVPSRTFTLVSKITSLAAKKYDMTEEQLNLSHFGESLRLAQHPGQLNEIAREKISHIIDADVLVIGVPTYQASYPGMFKHLFDMIDPHALVGKPVILAATGGTERHALMLEHQLRPLFHYFRVMTIPTAVYAASSEFDGFLLADKGLQSRVERATDELAQFTIRPELMYTRHGFAEQIDKARSVFITR